MNRTSIGGMVAVCLLMAATPSAFGQDASPLKTEKDQRSYALGMDLGRQLQGMQVEVDPAVFAKGLSDVLGGGKTLMTEDQVRETIMKMQEAMAARQLKGTPADPALAEENKKAGEAFLAANKAKPGVVTLPDGLQYKIVKAGTGAKPAMTDVVVCNYRGTFIDGTEFDSSYARNEPASFPVGGVIAGWTEALQLMPVGSTWQLVIPADLAYGTRGAGGRIGPNTTLVFEIELLSIQK